MQKQLWTQKYQLWYVSTGPGILRSFKHKQLQGTKSWSDWTTTGLWPDHFRPLWTIKVWWTSHPLKRISLPIAPSIWGYPWPSDPIFFIFVFYLSVDFSCLEVKMGFFWLSLSPSFINFLAAAIVIRSVGGCLLFTFLFVFFSYFRDVVSFFSLSEGNWNFFYENPSLTGGGKNLKGRCNF